MSTVASSLSNAPGASTTRRWVLDAVMRQPLLWLLGLLIVGGILSSPYFLSVSNVANLLRHVAVFGFLALGMNLVMITGRIDLSVGATMVFSVIAAVSIMVAAGAFFDIRMIGRGNAYIGPTVPLVILTLAVGVAVGVANGIGVAYGRVAPFIMTLVTLSALRGWSYVLSNGRPYYLRGEGYRWLGETNLGPVPVAAVGLLVVFAWFAWFLHKHVAGKRIYAIGGDEKTARFAGVRVERWIVLVYAASGLCAALAGLIFTSRANSVDAPMAAGYELSAIAIAVLGGTSLAGGQGSPYRTLCAALVFAIGLNLLTLHDVNAWYQELIIGIVLIAAVALGARQWHRTR